MQERIICHHPVCEKIPSLEIDPNSPKVKITCSIHKDKFYPIKDYLNICDKGNALICEICQKIVPSNNFIFYCNICKKYMDSLCYYKYCNKKNHNAVKKPYQSNSSNFDSHCQIHNKSYIKYCKSCKISLCEDCLKQNNNHKNHSLTEIKVKITNDINNLDNILRRQEEIFLKEKKIIYDYLEELENKIKLKRKIFENYKKNKSNGNALNNLENLNLNINQEIYSKLNSQNFEDINNIEKALSLYNFNKMCENKVNNDINLLNNIEKEVQSINKKNYLEDNKIKNNIIIHPKGKLIKRIPEKSKIYSLLTLDTGYFAAGFSNGKINIYKNDLSNRNSENNFQVLLTIDRFKGRRINYLYQLKDKTILCCTFSKIHHIKLKYSDRLLYDYLGTIKLSAYEIPKKIIELGNNFIVSLGEKKRKKENETRIKCNIRIFNKVNNNAQGGSQEEYFSDYESIKSFDSASEWESVFSSDEDKSSSENENMIKNPEYNDEFIKIYKKIKNETKLTYFCSIFCINNVMTNKIPLKFVSSSNAIFKGGDNSLSFYGIMKIPEKNGYCVYTEDKKIKNIACSIYVDSICFLDQDLIGVALQNEKESDFDGIALINVKENELKKIIKGLKIGIIKLNYINNKKNIVFFTNKKDIKKLDKFVIYEYSQRQNNIEAIENNIICSLKTGCRGIVELKNNNNRKNYYAIYTFEDIFILEILS